MKELAFSSIPVNGLVSKPRASGRTMMIDLGLPLGWQRDFLDIAGDCLDYVKIAVGISRLIKGDILKRKIQAYREHQVMAFPGGLFLEYAYSHGWIDRYFRECEAVGFPALEVSDNYIQFAPGRRDRLIRQAAERGFQAIAEIGRKDGSTALDDLVADCEDAAKAGAAVVLIEAGEIMGDRQAAVLTRLRSALPLDKVFFELPGYWLPGVAPDTNFRTMMTLLDALGAEANIASVLPDDVMTLGSLRIEIAGNIRLGDFAEGA